MMIAGRHVVVVLAVLLVMAVMSVSRVVSADDWHGRRQYTGDDEFLSAEVPFEQHHSPSLHDHHQNQQCPRKSVNFPSSDGRCHVLEGSGVKLGVKNDLIARLLADHITSYTDGVGEMRSHDLPSPRHVSNTMHKNIYGSDKPSNRFRTTQAFLYFGQFIDHDISLVGTSSREPYPIPVNSAKDEFLKHDIPFHRSSFIEGDRERPHLRRFVNEQTAWLDLSQVYGADTATQHRLRKGHAGQLLTQFTHGNEFPPFARAVHLRMSQGNMYSFACGDPRCNMHMMLFAFTTLFVREHNRLAATIVQDYQRESSSEELSDEYVFQEARRMNIRQYQRIVYEEWLPLLIGRRNMDTFLGEYDGYRPSRQNVPDVIDAFSAAAFRFGHSGVPDNFLFLDEHGGAVANFTADTDAAGKLRVSKAVFRADLVTYTGGLVIDYALNGALAEQHLTLNAQIGDVLRNEMFDGEVDLAAVNIQRGRDHGLAGLDYYREALGLEPWGCGVLAQAYANYECLDRFTGDGYFAGLLKKLYRHFDDIDVFTAGLCEKPWKKGQLGETFTAIIANQFRRLRDGDRFFYLAEQHPGPMEDMAELLARNFRHVRKVKRAFKTERPPKRKKEEEEEKKKKPKPEKKNSAPKDSKHYNNAGGEGDVSNDDDHQHDTSPHNNHRHSFDGSGDDEYYTDQHDHDDHRRQRHRGTTEPRF